MYLAHNHRLEEAGSELADVLTQQDTIQQIQSGEQIRNGRTDMRDFAKIQRINDERGTVGKQIRQALESGELPKEGTGNEVQQKIEAKREELREVFEKLTCIFDGNAFQISKPFFKILMDVLPGYIFSGKYVKFDGDKVVFLNTFGAETQRYGLYDFHEKFIPEAKKRFTNK